MGILVREPTEAELQFRLCVLNDGENINILRNN